MTIGEAIGQIDELVYNEIPRQTKRAWLSALDGVIHGEIHAGREGLEEEFSGYDENTPEDTVLLCPAPYAEVYRHYLEMHIHDANGEMTRYNNAAAKYNAAMVAYMDYVTRNFMPAERGKLKLI